MASSIIIDGFSKTWDFGLCCGPGGLSSIISVESPTYESSKKEEEKCHMSLENKKKKKHSLSFCRQPNMIKECHTSIKFLIHGEIRNDR